MSLTPKDYVASVDLTGTPRGIVAQDAATEAGAVFDQAKNQAQVVGSAVVAYAKPVDAQVREAVSDTLLLAQLVANKGVPLATETLQWLAAYVDVLQNLGWRIEKQQADDYTAKGTALEVHEKILEVMAAVLGPAPAALAIIASTVNALKAMDPKSPWITIFNRETQKAKLLRFQVGLVESAAVGTISVTLVACIVEAQKAITQVLFLKFKDAGASFIGRSSTLTVNGPAAVAVGPDVRAKVRAYQVDYLSSLKDL